MTKSIREKKMEQYIKEASEVSIYCECVRCWVRIPKGEARRLVKLEASGDCKPFGVQFSESGKRLYMR